MSYCPNCGRQILDESLGCPVCNVRNNIDPTKKPVPTEQTDEYKEGNSFREEAKAAKHTTLRPTRKPVMPNIKRKTP